MPKWQPHTRVRTQVISTLQPLFHSSSLQPTHECAHRLQPLQPELPQLLQVHGSGMEMAAPHTSVYTEESHKYLMSERVQNKKNEAHTHSTRLNAGNAGIPLVPFSLYKHRTDTPLLGVMLEEGIHELSSHSVSQGAMRVVSGWCLP